MRSAPASFSIITPSSSQQAGSATISQMTSGDSDADDEIERLRSMAAKIRAEVASLEADKAQEMADAAQKAFDKFDTNSDGAISLEELKTGLEKNLKIELSDKRAAELLAAFDDSGDGALQPEEMVSIDQFRNKLDALVREEKRLAREAADQAKREEEQAALAEAKLEMLNEKVPTNQEKVLSIIPYLFPLMDGLAYGRFLLSDEGVMSNPIVAAIGALYLLYRSIPFSGFIAFFALNFLGGNPSLNRLIRFNMQQAIFVDIALFFPGLLGGLLGAVGITKNLPQAFTVLSTDAIFASLLLVLGYCTVSSLLGFEPDKIPLISNNVKDRMPTIDMFDDEGRFIPRQDREGESQDDKKD